MNIYFAGIGGVGIGPLAQIARDAGHTVMGSDLHDGLITKQLKEQGIAIEIGNNTAPFLKACHDTAPIDWFVYTAALPADHPELLLAASLGITTGKRDAFLAEFISHHNLTLLAVAGTHGKTTTTGMAIWALKELGIPVSYSVGTTLTFGPSGAYDPDSNIFVYECDEFDRNFLHFAPDLSLITSIDYDHPDTYPTEESYKAAFRQYVASSKHTIAWQHDLAFIEQGTLPSITTLKTQDVQDFALVGYHNRQNATLVYNALTQLEVGRPEQLRAHIESFPGTDRRFEKIANNIYSDYGHHPQEIAATLQLAKEVSDKVALVYQPHQNVRQHEIAGLYTDTVFKDADKVFWLPTYLSREDPDLAILQPSDLVQGLRETQVTIAELDDSLWQTIEALAGSGYLVLCMGAGSIDGWLRTALQGSAGRR